MSDPSATPPPEAIQPAENLQAMELQAMSLQTMPSLIDNMATLEESRMSLAAALSIVEKEQERLLSIAHRAMALVGARTFSTDKGEIELKPLRVYKSVDWEKLQTHIRITSEFDLLQRRLSITALDQRNELPPGVEKMVFDRPVFKAAKENAGSV